VAKLQDLCFSALSLAWLWLTTWCLAISEIFYRSRRVEKRRW
jgi:hypothetical protein